MHKTKPLWIREILHPYPPHCTSTHLTRAAPGQCIAAPIRTLG